MSWNRLPVVDEEILAEERQSSGILIFARRNDTLTVSVKNSSSVRNFGISLVKKIFQDVFLPRGYPSSVSSDYMEYQIWDTVQAFCSTLNSTLTTHAIFKAVGVGNQEATALAATITWIMKDGSGMIGRIAFAWWKGYFLDTECKKWRLVADVTNDFAMFLELLLRLMWFKNYAPIVLCMSTAMKATVGVAGGATRAAITQHQAIRGNMGDISAKDGSQETCVNLLASILAVFILTSIENNIWTMWILFFFSTALHLFSNYKAVKSLNIKTLNGSRFLLVVKEFLENYIVCSPKVINQRENVFLGFGISDQFLCSKKINLGCSLRKFAENDHSSLDCHSLKNLRRTYSLFPYLIFNNHQSIDVILQENISDKDVIQAYFHALILGIVCRPIQIKKLFDPHIEFDNLIEKCRISESCDVYVNDFVLKKWEELSTGLIQNGWKLNVHQLPMDEFRVKWC